MHKNRIWWFSSLEPLQDSRLRHNQLLSWASGIIDDLHQPTVKPENASAPRCEKIQSEIPSEFLSAPGKPFTRHPRNWHENKFVYPVLSRRESIGQSQPDKSQFRLHLLPGRAPQRSRDEVRRDRPVAPEIDHMLSLVAGGVFEDEPFRDVPAEHRRSNDIAFSGDGRPTRTAISTRSSAVADLKQHGRPEVKLVLITNASMFHRPLSAGSGNSRQE